VVVYDGFMTDYFEGLINTAVFVFHKKTEKFAINSMELILKQARPQGAIFLKYKISAVCPHIPLA
jgi:hypothetical protein